MCEPIFNTLLLVFDKSSIYFQGGDWVLNNFFFPQVIFLMSFRWRITVVFRVKGTQLFWWFLEQEKKSIMIDRALNFSSSSFHPKSKRSFSYFFPLRVPTIWWHKCPIKERCRYCNIDVHMPCFFWPFLYTHRITIFTIGLSP